MYQTNAFMYIVFILILHLKQQQQQKKKKICTSVNLPFSHGEAMHFGHLEHLAFINLLCNFGAYYLYICSLITCTIRLQNAGAVINPSLRKGLFRNLSY